MRVYFTGRQAGRYSTSRGEKHLRKKKKKKKKKKESLAYLTGPSFFLFSFFCGLKEYGVLRGLGLDLMGGRGSWLVTKVHKLYLLPSSKHTFERRTNAR